MRKLGAPLGVVLILGACSVINKFEEVQPEAAGGDSSTGGEDTGGRGGVSGTGGSNGGTSGDGGAPPEGGTGATSGDAGETGTGGATPTGGASGNGNGGSGGCAAPTTFYRDADEDTYGSDDTTRDGCEAPTGYVDRGGDCNDDDAAINPGATELCNGLDENCDEPDEDDTCPPDCVPQLVAQRLRLLCRGPVTWSAARDACVEERMLLSRIRDSAESVAVRDTMQTTVQVNTFWLGGSDGPAATDEGTWRWLVGGDVFYPNTALYNNWASGEPSNAFAVQDCLQVIDGRWYAQECQLTAGFVCEETP